MKFPKILFIPKLKIQNSKNTFLKANAE